MGTVVFRNDIGSRRGKRGVACHFWQASGLLNAGKGRCFLPASIQPNLSAFFPFISGSATDSRGSSDDAEHCLIVAQDPCRPRPPSPPNHWPLVEAKAVVPQTVDWNTTRHRGQILP